MKLIPLTYGYYAQVSNQDYSLVKKYHWHLVRSYKTLYARTWVKEKKRKILMHNLILGVKGIDHIDGDGLNNMRSNLRVVSRSLNRHNSRLNKNNKSGFRGVWWRENRQAWMASITVNRKPIFLLYTHDKKEAALAYDKAAKKYFGKKAKLNFP